MMTFGIGVLKGESANRHRNRMGSRSKTTMARKEQEKDSDRPRYYSQFWLDIAAGRRVIGEPRDDEEMSEVEPASTHRSGRDGSGPSNGYRETIVHPDVEALDEDNEDSEDDVEVEENFPVVDEEDADEFAVDDALEDAEIPNIDVESAIEEDTEPLKEEIKEEILENQVDFDVEDEEEEWEGPRGRKKVKPTRAAKPPAKRTKRESPRHF